MGIATKLVDHRALCGSESRVSTDAGFVHGLANVGRRSTGPDIRAATRIDFNDALLLHYGAGRRQCETRNRWTIYDRIRCRELLATASCIPDMRINAENDRNVGMDRNATIRTEDVMCLSLAGTTFTVLRYISRTLR